MPVLPQHPATTAADTRIIDARQLTTAAAQSLSSHLRSLLRRVALDRRQDTAVCNAGYVAGCYQGINAGPSPGAVVGIVLGSIAGFLFLLWLLWVLSSGTSFIRTTNLEEEDVVVTRRRSRSPRSGGGGTRRSTHRSSYNAEVRHSSPRRERVIRQERIVRNVPREEMSRVRESEIVEESRPERRVEGDDIVEVIEEHSSISAAPQTRRKSRRASGYRT